MTPNRALVTVLVALCGHLVVSQLDNCPTGWVDGAEKGCFAFDVNKTNLSWSLAQDHCEGLSGYLAEPILETQANLLQSIADGAAAFTGIDAWWIGLSDSGHEGRWIWAHSVEDTNYTQWGTNFPDNSTGNLNDCAIITFVNSTFVWEDVNCHSTDIDGRKIAPICQVDVVPPTTTAPPPTTTLDPNLIVLVNDRNNNTNEGNVYSVNSLGIYGPVCDDNWDNVDAKVVCKQLGYLNGFAAVQSWYGSVPGGVYAFDNVNCVSSNTRLHDCSHLTSDNCGSSEAAGVLCTN